MGGLLAVVYGGLCYLVFFLVFLYAIGFVGDFLTPTSLNHGTPSPAVAAWIIDIVLLGLFAIQHSGMARRGFKRWLTGWFPRSIERSTYVLVSSLILALMFWQWRPLGGTVWNVTTPWAYWLLYAAFAFGWFMVLSSTFLIDHFDLFGLRQVWLRMRGREYTPPRFKEHVFYRLIRHPLMLGFLIAFWAIPRMSLGHLLFAVATTGYILIALQLEERDLVAAHGDDYRRYREEVPMLCPWPRPRQRGVAPEESRS